MLLEIDRHELSLYFSPFDRKRIDAYANGFCEQHVITDLLPIIARHVFLDKLKVNLTPVQAAILLCRGLQHKEIGDIECEIGLHSSQILALLQKSIKRISEAYAAIDKLAVEKEIFHNEPRGRDGTESSDYECSKMSCLIPLNREDSLENELEQAGNKLIRDQHQFLGSIDLSRYAIIGNEEEWTNTLNKQGYASSISILNPRSSKHRITEPTNTKKSSKISRFKN